MLKLNVTFLRSLREKSIGLIGAKKIYLVYFTTRWGIHTFGVKFPIDVLVLDKNRRIVKIVQNLSRNRLYIWPPIYKDVVELPAGEVASKRIKVGDELTLHFLND